MAFFSEISCNPGLSLNFSDPVNHRHPKSEEDYSSRISKKMDKRSIDSASTETLRNHYRIAVSIFKISDSDTRRKLQKSIQMKHGVIPTPDLLYDKHIIREFKPEKAQSLSLQRFRGPDFQEGRQPKVNTVYEDPKKFYFHPDLNWIISKEPVNAYQVEQYCEGKPIVRFIGKKWAIFSGEPTYHFFFSSLQMPTD